MNELTNFSTIVDESIAAPEIFGITRLWDVPLNLILNWIRDANVVPLLGQEALLITPIFKNHSVHWQKSLQRVSDNDSFDAQASFDMPRQVISVLELKIDGIALASEASKREMNIEEQNNKSRITLHTFELRSPTVIPKW